MKYPFNLRRRVIACVVSDLQTYNMTNLCLAIRIVCIVSLLLLLFITNRVNVTCIELRSTLCLQIFSILILIFSKLWIFLNCYILITYKS